ncbi:hypothetical protein FB45DRAFT_1013756 [Roridomyces roridus]|uniref:DUF6533 domain-containing protein n=1 Tax=Roridomyces roridus TaxID=1738132 RepID=A0AAD7F8W7_9AGAR|nr:hypothetical protein FB45DRAFT_1013756 [Roridomyces roridus]
MKQLEIAGLPLCNDGDSFAATPPPIASIETLSLAQECFEHTVLIDWLVDTQLSSMRRLKLYISDPPPRIVAGVSGLSLVKSVGTTAFGLTSGVRSWVTAGTKQSREGCFTSEMQRMAREKLYFLCTRRERMGSSKEPKTKKLGETQETRARPRSSRCVVVVGNKRRGRVPVNGTETELSSAVKHGGPVPRPTASDSPSAEMLITRRPAETRNFGRNREPLSPGLMFERCTALQSLEITDSFSFRLDFNGSTLEWGAYISQDLIDMLRQLNCPNLRRLIIHVDVGGGFRKLTQDPLPAFVEALQHPNYSRLELLALQGIWRNYWDSTVRGRFEEWVVSELPPVLRSVMRPSKAQMPSKAAIWASSSNTRDARLQRSVIPHSLRRGLEETTRCAGALAVVFRHRREMCGSEQGESQDVELGERDGGREQVGSLIPSSALCSSNGSKRTKPSQPPSVMLRFLLILTLANPLLARELMDSSVLWANHTLISAAAIFCYDYLLTFSEELKYYQHRRYRQFRNNWKFFALRCAVLDKIALGLDTSFQLCYIYMLSLKVKAINGIRTTIPIVALGLASPIINVAVSNPSPFPQCRLLGSTATARIITLLPCLRAAFDATVTMALLLGLHNKLPRFSLTSTTPLTSFFIAEELISTPRMIFVIMAMEAVFVQIPSVSHFLYLENPNSAKAKYPGARPRPKFTLSIRGFADWHRLQPHRDPGNEIPTRAVQEKLGFGHGSRMSGGIVSTLQMGAINDRIWSTDNIRNTAGRIRIAKNGGGYEYGGTAELMAMMAGFDRCDGQRAGSGMNGGIDPGQRIYDRARRPM